VLGWWLALKERMKLRQTANPILVEIGDAFRVDIEKKMAEKV
jgi:hypothetical protein